MIKLFDKKPILDEAVIAWMFDAYGWSLRHFDAKVFFNETRLVYPNNDFFPGEENTPEEKSRLILDQVKKHASMERWPVQIVDEDRYLESSYVNQPPKLLVDGNSRGSTAMLPKIESPEDSLYIVYQPALLQNPQALIANYAQMLASYLGYTANEPPPGGSENWPLITEMVAIFMGFGLMYANTSGNVGSKSCASCQVPTAERINYLSQYEAAYALAIFAKLKKIEFSEIKPYLKKTLHAFYRKAIAELDKRAAELDRLREFAK